MIPRRSYRILAAALLLSLQCFATTDTIRLADPTIFPYHGKYYLYGTGNAAKGFTVQVSSDLKKWSAPAGKNNGYALVKGEAFGEKGFWAPQLFAYRGRFYMAYTADEQIAIAFGDSPLGPFRQTVQKHLAGDGKKIDPYIFEDRDGQLYLYHVRLEQGNRLFVARLKPDLSDIFPETLQPVLSATEPWENTENRDWTVTEGPTVVLEQGTYFLFYSANDFRNKDYAVGCATSKSPMGPWTKLQNSPLISRQQLGINGTGHGDLFKNSKGQWQYVLHTHYNNVTVSPRLTGIVDLRFLNGGFQPVNNSFRYLEEAAAGVRAKE
ncbi:glycoside hydrolase family 43 protein [Flavihumibacter petaseus]|uniref:Putative glycosidase n=1 Tax=Flavihumibacter petaseus NBRC 106054 TaxID=1220578 RepID=A0A0E9MVF7_9BACT|nr:glycoside hydrolase family 43 protein [Flavihumibacter petaseus]GAO41564.1 putative glycosidase [Flavihumibacter petaseus NBRC 106054]